MQLDIKQGRKYFSIFFYLSRKTLCKILDFGHFIGPTLLGYKIVNTSPIFA